MTSTLNIGQLITPLSLKLGMPALTNGRQFWPWTYDKWVPDFILNLGQMSASLDLQPRANGWQLWPSTQLTSPATLVWLVQHSYQQSKNKYSNLQWKKSSDKVLHKVPVVFNYAAHIFFGRFQILQIHTQGDWLPINWIRI